VVTWYAPGQHFSPEDPGAVFLSENSGSERTGGVFRKRLAFFVVGRIKNDDEDQTTTGRRQVRWVKGQIEAKVGALASIAHSR
jgi:hypothetical protein